MKFTNKIYEKLKKVPKGNVVTYGDLARAVNSNAYRAVGSAMRTNKDSIGIPCYKVINSSGFVGNYSGNGGVRRKIELLRKDRIKIVDNKIDLRRFGYKFK